MPESPEEIHARVVAAVGESGRLPMPDLAAEDAFPWEVVDGVLVPKVLPAPVEFEAPRAGLGDAGCGICEGSSEAVRIWEGDAFHVARPTRPSGFPLTLFLNADEHLDLPELDDEQAAEFGRITVWLTRIIEGLPHVGRVHVNRWGDGTEHLHTWFVARPARLPGVRGWLAAAWAYALPPVDEDVWLADCAAVAHKLANHAGRALI